MFPSVFAGNVYSALIRYAFRVLNPDNAYIIDNEKIKFQVDGIEACALAHHVHAF